MLKKLIISTSAILSISASAAPGVYIAGHVGLLGLGVGTFAPSVSFGYDFGNNIRAGVDYAYYYGSTAFVKNDIVTAVKPLTESAYTAGLSVNYEIEQNLIPVVKPYIGVRLGGTYISNNFESQRIISISGLAGINYPLKKKLTLDFGYSAANALSLGLRYTF